MLTYFWVFAVYILRCTKVYFCRLFARFRCLRYVMVCSTTPDISCGISRDWFNRVIVRCARFIGMIPKSLWFGCVDVVKSDDVGWQGRCRFALMWLVQSLDSNSDVWSWFGYVNLQMWIDMAVQSSDCSHTSMIRVTHLWLTRSIVDAVRTSVISSDCSWLVSSISDWFGSSWIMLD